MPAITALLHTRNDALRLGRALETLLPCDEILIVDHGSQDATLRIAREYGARIVTATRPMTPAEYLELATHEWILWMEPCEALTESLSASLFEWKMEPHAASQACADSVAFSVYIREEIASGLHEISNQQIRLLPRGWKHWKYVLPDSIYAPILLEGLLLSFKSP